MNEEEFNKLVQDARTHVSTAKISGYVTKAEFKVAFYSHWSDNASELSPPSPVPYDSADMDMPFVYFWADSIAKADEVVKKFNELIKRYNSHIRSIDIDSKLGWDTIHYYIGAKLGWGKLP